VSVNSSHVAPSGEIRYSFPAATLVTTRLGPPGVPSGTHTGPSPNTIPSVTISARMRRNVRRGPLTSISRTDRALMGGPG